MQKQPPEIITNGGNTEFVQQLNANGVAFIVVGGAAVAVHGCRDMEAVDDLDIVINSTTDNAERFIAVLAACHINFQHPVSALARPGIQLPVKSLHYYLDVLTPRDTSFADMLAKSVPATLDSMAVRVAGRDDLIAMKRFAIAQNDASREKHEADLARLLPRTTAMGLLTDAKEMLLAASILSNSDEWKVQGPTYYLLGHATELALKSFLLANGDSQIAAAHRPQPRQSRQARQGDEVQSACADCRRKFRSHRAAELRS